MTNIENYQQSINPKTIALFVDYGKKSIELQPISHPKYKYRDNLLYRVQSSVFHLSLINHVKALGIKSLADNEKDRIPILLMQIVREVYFTFEDLVYSLISQIDYLGNLIGYIYIGEHKGNLKWNGIAKHCRANNQNEIIGALKKVIVEEDRRLFNHLYEYRSNLIHYKCDGSEAIHEESFNGDNTNHSLLIKSPEKLCSIMKNIEIKKDEDISVIAYKLTEDVFKVTEVIINIIASEIIPKNKANMKIIVDEYKKSNGM
jgi:CRISPR/Cas system-associated endoribonuclease Cas2